MPAGGGRLAGASGALWRPGDGSKQRIARVAGRVSAAACVRCPGGPRKLCTGTAAASPGDGQLEGPRPLHLPWPSPAQLLSQPWRHTRRKGPYNE